MRSLLLLLFYAALIVMVCCADAWLWLVKRLSPARQVSRIPLPPAR
jgi:hypothetical protein